MQLHLCLIAGRDNRYNYLRHTVGQALPVFDAIHIMDTGSTDRTFELASWSQRINFFHWDRWEHGWTDAYDRVRRDVPTGAWFLYLDSDEAPSQYMLDHIRASVTRLEREGYGQARIPNVLHVDGRRVGDPAADLPRTPEEFERRPCWTKSIVCRNGPWLTVDGFGMHAGFNNREQPVGFLPLYYCHHKHGAQIDASISIGSLVLPESYDIPPHTDESRALRRLMERLDTVDPGRVVDVLQNDPPADFVALVAQWGNSDLKTCRHWHDWYRNGFSVGDYPLRLCGEECCRYDRNVAPDTTINAGSVPGFLGDWKLEVEGDQYRLTSTRNRRALECNDSAAAVASQIDGRADVATIVNTFAESFPESAAGIRDDTFQVLKELTSIGAVSMTTRARWVPDATRRAIAEAVALETAYWRERGEWSEKAMQNHAEEAGWVVASFSNGTVTFQWNGNESNRCRPLGPYLQCIALENADIQGVFVINPHDAVGGTKDYPVLGFSKRPEAVQAVLVPDLYFVAGYGPLRERIRSAVERVQWQHKLERAVWRGAPTGQINDESNWRDNLRIRLCLRSLVRPRLIDAALSSFGQCNDASIQMMREAGLGIDRLPEEKQMFYKYLINVDGNSSAWSATFWKLLPNSLMIQVVSDRPDDERAEQLPGFSGHRQWYHHWLQRDRHLVACTIGELDDVVRWAREHDDQCRDMAENATAFAEQYLTEDAGSQYFIEILRALGRIRRRPSTTPPRYA
ncbi:MAG: glycosyl transferase family 90 [Arenicellales bacterium]